MTATLGTRIAARRRALKLTQRELAKRVDCEQATIARIERGVVKSPRAQLLYAISKHLKMSAQTLLGGR